jgi:hypothetical protein
MPPKPRLTAIEKNLRECSMLNMGAEVAYRRNRYWAAKDEGLSQSATRRRQREFSNACEAPVEVSASRLPDAYLRHAYGEDAVHERGQLLGAGADVFPLKRNGRPIT